MHMDVDMNIGLVHGMEGFEYMTWEGDLTGFVICPTFSIEARMVG